MKTYVLILIFYVSSNGAQLVQTTLPDKYSDEAACMEAGDSMKYVSKRDAADLKIGFVCVQNGAADDDDND